MGSAWSTPVAEVPGFVLCDGHFEASAPHGELSGWCGWIRFEGHGECKIRPSEASVDEWSGRWSALDAETVRIAISGDGRGARGALLMRDGGEVDTIHLSAEGSAAPPTLFTFVPD
ncbi:hypothetical protein AB1Y20_021695 [Prymnesium parvum]|uniref:Uncharacterized protein n=1 Tax=Prymnesium parvum TaxID=97485 RepID=A0AB34JKF8_PRYPA